MAAIFFFVNRINMGAMQTIVGIESGDCSFGSESDIDAYEIYCSTVLQRQDYKKKAKVSKAQGEFKSWIWDPCMDILESFKFGISYTVGDNQLSPAFLVKDGQGNNLTFVAMMEKGWIKYIEKDGKTLRCRSKELQAVTNKLYRYAVKFHTHRFFLSCYEKSISFVLDKNQLSDTIATGNPPKKPLVKYLVQDIHDTRLSIKEVLFRTIFEEALFRFYDAI